MMIYILKSTFCLALMLAMYFLFLEKEKMYRFNRFYLLFSIVFSYLVPFNSITVYSQVTMVVRNYPVQVHHIGLQNLATPIKYVQPERDLLMPFLLIVYCLGAAYFLFRYIKNIYLIFSRISRSEIIVLGNAKIVLLEQDIISYTFLHYVFINATLYKEQHMEREVFTHELTHVRQKHSLDVLFIELLQVFFWFNPILILYKKAIQLNHEFLADEAVISTFNNVKHYQQLLINKISLNNSMCLTSSFNYQVTKKRLIMMTMTTNHWRALYKKAATVSLIVSAVYLFSTRVEAKHISYLRQPETRDTKAYPKKK